MVHAIAAGEVIDSLAAVVRELVENSLDAGATRIQVAVWPDRAQVRVSDNGRGMTRADLQAAAQPHSTSKIRESADLWRISSLGFRGEALYSLAQLGQLEICSRSALDPQAQGWRQVYCLGQPRLQPEPWAMAPGTVVQVSDLFAQWPARRQVLPSVPHQLRAIQRTIQHLALCHPGVTWAVTHSDRPWFHLRPGTTAQDILPQLLRDVQPSDLQFLSLTVMPPEPAPTSAWNLSGGEESNGDGSDGDGAKGDTFGYNAPQSQGETTASGATTQDDATESGASEAALPVADPSEADPSESDWPAADRSVPEQFSPAAGQSSPAAQLDMLVGLPDRCHRRRSDWVNVAVNGRIVQMPELEQSLIQGFRRTLPRDRFPVCFVHLHLTPAHVDWNRHPAKREIYLRHLNFWQTQLHRAIDQALALRPESLTEVSQTQRVGQLLKAAEQAQGYGIQRQIASSPSVLSPDPGQAPAQVPAQYPVQLSDDLGAIGSRAIGSGSDCNTAIDAATRSVPSAAASFEGQLRAMAQLHQMYILAEHPTGIWLIEQHIAHERVLFEQIQSRWELVPLESPLLLSHLTERQREQLQRLGIEVDEFGEQVWAVRSAPALLVDRADCREAILELSRGGDLQSAQVATACRSAIRNGQPLTLPEMQQLLNQWQQTRSPRTCPHGRPICLTLEERRLSRFFRRHWVVGKSHGI